MKATAPREGNPWSGQGGGGCAAAGRARSGRRPGAALHGAGRVRERPLGGSCWVSAGRVEAFWIVFLADLSRRGGDWSGPCSRTPCCPV